MEKKSEGSLDAMSGGEHTGEGEISGRPRRGIRTRVKGKEMAVLLTGVDWGRPGKRFVRGAQESLVYADLSRRKKRPTSANCWRKEGTLDLDAGRKREKRKGKRFLTRLFERHVEGRGPILAPREGGEKEVLPRP